MASPSASKVKRFICVKNKFLRARSSRNVKGEGEASKQDELEEVDKG